MNKTRNEPMSEARLYGTQLRYVSKRRIRTLRARAKREGIPLHWRPFGQFYSWLRPVPLCWKTDACRVQ